MADSVVAAILLSGVHCNYWPTPYNTNENIVNSAESNYLFVKMLVENNIIVMK